MHDSEWCQSVMLTGCSSTLEHETLQDHLQAHVEQAVHATCCKAYCFENGFWYMLLL